MSDKTGPVLVRGGPREGLYFKTRSALLYLLSHPEHSRGVTMPADKAEPVRYRGLALHVATEDDWNWLQVALGLEYFRRKT